MHKIVEPIGLVSWGAKNGIGSHITLELGEQRQTDRGKKMGHWSIWVTDVPWRIVSQREFLVGSGSEELGSDSLNVLNDKTLLAIEIGDPALDVRFKFSDGVELQVFIDTDDDHCELMIMSEKETVFINGSGSIGVEPSTPSI